MESFAFQCNKSFEKISHSWACYTWNWIVHLHPQNLFLGHGICNNSWLLATGLDAIKTTLCYQALHRERMKCIISVVAHTKKIPGTRLRAAAAAAKKLVKDREEEKKKKKNPIICPLTRYQEDDV